MLKETISIGELFCGPGGLGYAAKNLKIRHKNIIYKFSSFQSIVFTYKLNKIYVFF